MSSILLREVRLVPVGPIRASSAPLDVRIVDAIVSDIAAGLEPAADEVVLDTGGRWLIPGLWDAHVHLTQWALMTQRLDLASATSAEHASGIVAQAVADLPAGWTGVVQGWGHRSATWPRRPTVAELDAVSGQHPVVLISGDCHHAWANSRALELLGLHPRQGVVEEREWFEALPRLGDLPGVADLERVGLADAVRRANAAGVVGITDMEFSPGHLRWPSRVVEGITGLRVRTAVYPERLAEVTAAGLRTGQVLDGLGLVTMGPLKIISDGSLNTRTAWCHEPYADAADLRHPRGVRNHPPAELADLLGRAWQAGLGAAVHAIGDAAVSDVLDVLADVPGGGAGRAVGPGISIEHAQLVDPADLPRMAALGVTASVQPAHLLDDRAVTMQCWPDRADRCFALRSFTEAGVPLALGSDAPVAALDPWLAMAAAVWRGADGEPAWNPDESLTAPQALAASVDGRGTVAVGSPADLALLDDDPLREQDPAQSATVLRSMTVAATVTAGRISHLAL